MVRLMAVWFGMAAAILLGLNTGPAWAKRVALVIGNGAYLHAAPLPNPRNDADAISQALRELGFDVIHGVDLDRNNLESAVRDFAKAARGAELTLFFFAGHALQVAGKNYLMPIDAELLDETDLDFQTVSMDAVLRNMERERRTNLIILDACRNNPLAKNLARSMGTRSASIGRGLAPLETGVGTLISFATQPGNVALDGDGRNSPFTTALLRHIDRPNLDVAIMMRHVRREVMEATNGNQVPWSNSSLTDVVYLNEDDAAVATEPTPIDPAEHKMPPHLGSEDCERVDGADLCASSFLASQGRNTYRVANLIDGDARTAWVEGASDDGIGESLLFEFEEPQRVRMLELRNGYTKSEDIFRKNNRIREIEIIPSAGHSVVITLEDIEAMQRIDLSGMEAVRWLQLRINSVYRGSKYRDTALSELRFIR